MTTHSPPPRASSNWPYLAANNTCFDCETNDEPSKLPDDKLTEECTDQCVVITCDDPDHAATICSGTGEHVHCDLDCDSTIDCTDCNGFDAFLQCCREDAFCHAPPPHSPQEISNDSMWEAMQEWCTACGDIDSTTVSGSSSVTNVHHQDQQHQHHQYNHPHQQHHQYHHQQDQQKYSTNPLEDQHNNHSYDIPRPDIGEGQSYSHLPVPTQFPSSTFAHQREAYAQSASSTKLAGKSPSILKSSINDGTKYPSPLFVPTTTTTPSETAQICMWSACQTSFPSLPDLVNHVNHNHLSRDFAMTESFLPIDQKERPCLWENCDSESYFSLSDSDEFLNHLMTAHLRASGINWPPYYPPNTDDSKLHKQPVASSSKLPTPVPSPPVSAFSDTPADINSATPDLHHDDCAADVQHECRWRDCHASFTSCNELTGHITDVHIGGGRPHYECFWDDCSRNAEQGFQSKQKICRHVQSHTGHRPFQCSICHQHFSEAATLQQHIRRHTQEKPYVCDHPGCGKSFAITGALTIHKRTHNGDKPFKCKYCERGFAESSNLSKHLRTHTGARPYECTEIGCKKAFARPDQLNRHKAVHKKQLRGVGGHIAVQ